MHFQLLNLKFYLDRRLRRQPLRGGFTPDRCSGRDLPSSSAAPARSTRCHWSPASPTRWKMIRMYALGDLEHKVSVLRSLCAEIGRDPAEIVLSVEAVLVIAPDQAALPDVAEVAERRSNT